MKKSQSGFTLVELVVVILILGILSATALPRFMDVNNQAHSAAVAGAGGGFGAGVALAHAQWVANGSGTTNALLDNIVGFGDGIVDVSDGTVAGSTAGWPTDTAGLNTLGGIPAQCVNIWNAIMQNPPTVLSGGAGCGADYCAAAAVEVCTYTYDAIPAKTIAYSAATGAVVVTN